MSCPEQIRIEPDTTRTPGFAQRALHKRVLGRALALDIGEARSRWLSCQRHGDVLVSLSFTFRTDGWLTGCLCSEYGWTKYPVAYGRAMNLSRQLRDEYDAAFVRVL